MKKKDKIFIADLSCGVKKYNDQFWSSLLSEGVYVSARVQVTSIYT